MTKTLSIHDFTRIIRIETGRLYDHTGIDNKFVHSVLKFLTFIYNGVVPVKEQL